MSLLYTTVSGLEFNNIYKGVAFCKFLNNNLNHNGFQYNIGLNVDNNPFNPSGQCLKGGLYFFEESKFDMYCSYYGSIVAHVEIPDDAYVYIEEDKFKADKFIITEIVGFVNDDNHKQKNPWVKILLKEGRSLKYLMEEFQTEELCKLAVINDGHALKYVLNKFKTELLCKVAVQRNGMALEFVPDDLKTEEICIIAVNNDYNAMQFVPQK